MHKLNTISGQITIEEFYDISFNPEYKIVQANDFITARQDLSFIEAKIIRLAILQILSEDNKFKPYEIELLKLQSILKCDRANLYVSAKKIADSISSKYIGIRMSNGSFKNIPWVSFCEYDVESHKFRFMLNEQLKGYLIGLKEKGHYTQYMYEMTDKVSNINNLRLLELLIEHAKCDIFSINKDGIDINLSISEIKDALMLYRHMRRARREGKNIVFAEYLDLYEKNEKGQMIPSYNRGYDYKRNIIDKFVKEINNTGYFNISYSDIKKPGSKKISGFCFHLERTHFDWAKKNPIKAQKIEEKANAIWDKHIGTLHT